MVGANETKRAYSGASVLSVVEETVEMVLETMVQVGLWLQTGLENVNDGVAK
jgi:hypothetical protein